jgi:ankyrin repeat protein
VSAQACPQAREAVPLHEEGLELGLGQDLIQPRDYLPRNFTLNVRGKDGETAVHCAARHGLVDYLAFLVAEKAPVDVADAAGQTPLHRAAGGAGADLAFVKALVAAGASPAATDKAGKTPADLVNTAQHQDIADFLRAAAGKAGGTP